jgi:RNA polymerase sigma-70 factor (ECF subfamily)
MRESARPASSTLLITRLLTCPRDAALWEEFVRRYSEPIYAWCRKCNLQDADAQDVTQNVFTTLLKQLQTFDRSQARFRTWLYRIVVSRICDWCEQPAQRYERGTDAARALLASEQARRDLEARLNEEFDLELLETAERNVRLRVEPQTWDAYQLCCKEHRKPREAAERLGLPAGHVSKYALRVRDLVTREIAALEAACGPDGMPS